MPFNGGLGGKAEPIAGASNNGMSNNFPKVSPDGKWIVFVKNRNGQLMRPDSELYIVPAQGEHRIYAVADYSGANDVGTGHGAIRECNELNNACSALVTTAIDLGGRAYFVFQADFPTAKIGDFDSELVFDFWQAFSANALCNLHIILHYGRNSHHIAEGIFKAAARSLRAAIEIDPRQTGVPSTKGVL